MSELKTNKISPATATSLTVGESGDTVTVPSGATLNVSNATVNFPNTVTASTELKTNKISPASGTTMTMGDSGDTFTIPSGVTFANSGTATGFGGALTKISSTTFTNQASFAITTGIDSTYDVYIFKFIDYNPATDNTHLTFQCSTDGGSNYNTTLTTTVFYARHYESDASVLQYDTGDDQAQGTSYQKVTLGVGNESDASGSGEIYLFAPSSTTYVKHFYATSNLLYALDASTNYFTAGYFNTTSAINAISFKPVTGNFDGTIQMWGL
jgi:hypothetical protein